MPAKSSAESGGSRVVPPVDCRSPHNLPNVDFWEDFLFGSLAKILILLVPGEGLEPPTNGLQNRCSTTELTRQLAHNTRKLLTSLLGQTVGLVPDFVPSRDGRIWPLGPHRLLNT